MTEIGNVAAGDAAQAAPAMQSIVLIDYDNVQPRHERAPCDIEATLAHVRALILTAAAKLFGGRAEVSIRLYDERGWRPSRAC
jgi:hypothetical protein